MRKLTVEVEEGLLRSAQRLAFESELKMAEVVRRLLAAYVEGRVKIRRRDEPGG